MMSRIRRNQGRIEFLANSETVTDLLEQGFDRKKIFEHLRKNNSISMGYSTFCKVFAKLMHPQKQKLAQVSAQKLLPVPATPRSGPQIVGKKVEGNPADPRTYVKDNLM